MISSHCTPPVVISTHAPRAGSDARVGLFLGSRLPISTHAPRAGSDGGGEHRGPDDQHFNPRSPCGERLGTGPGTPCLRPFQPTLPVRGATRACRRTPPARRHFNPRSPCGERLSPFIPLGAYNVFQPTLPVRGATKALSNSSALGCISTHAPRAGSDTDRPTGEETSTHFNPRSPCGERPGDKILPDVAPVISTHAPRAGSDFWWGSPRLLRLHISTHAPRAGSDGRYRY